MNVRIRSSYSDSSMPRCCATDTSWPSGRLPRPDERSHDPPAHFACEDFRVQSRAVQYCLGVLELVNACALDVDLLEPGVREQGAILLLFQGAGHAADPQLHTLAHGGGHLSPNHDIGHRESAAGFEYPPGLRQDAGLVGREVDH